jgi:hypothetical protein
VNLETQTTSLGCYSQKQNGALNTPLHQKISVLRSKVVAFSCSLCIYVLVFKYKLLHPLRTADTLRETSNSLPHVRERERERDTRSSSRWLILLPWILRSTFKDASTAYLIYRTQTNGHFSVHISQCLFAQSSLSMENNSLHTAF